MPSRAPVLNSGAAATRDHRQIIDSHRRFVASLQKFMPVAFSASRARRSLIPAATAWSARAIRCASFLKLFERIYAPLTVGLLKPFSGDRKLAEEKRCTLDRLYQRIVDDLDELLCAVGLKTAA